MSLDQDPWSRDAEVLPQSSLMRRTTSSLCQQKQRSASPFFWFSLVPPGLDSPSGRGRPFPLVCPKDKNKLVSGGGTCLGLFQQNVRERPSKEVPLEALSFPDPPRSLTGSSWRS